MGDDLVDVGLDLQRERLGCRGCIETLMYGEEPLANLYDHYQMARAVPLRSRANLEAPSTDLLR